MRSTNVNGTEYYDFKYADKNNGERIPRRIHETNLFMTINTNRQSADMNALKATMEEIFGNPAHVAQVLVLGPVDKRYATDQLGDVLIKVFSEAGIERGPTNGHVHAHVWVTLEHCSQLQIGSRKMQQLVKLVYNSKVSPDDKLKKQPFCYISL